LATERLGISDRAWGLVILSLSGAVILMGINVALPGIVLGLGLIFRTQIAEKIPKHWITTFFSFFGVFMLFELGAALDPYTNGSGEAVRFHEQVGADLMISLLYHVPWALAWAFLARMFEYKTWSVFWISGIFGAFTEQSGAFPILFLSGQIVNALGGGLLSLFLYGTTTAAGYIIAEGSFPPHRKTSRWRFVLPFILIPLLILLSFTLFLKLT
jgi:hypothetical protein